ncbi:MAG: helix-turn-helix domain-containing protein [Desulfurococcaceae archaeon]
MVADKYQSSVIVSRGGVVVEIPENVALLPLREKEKYIVELRKQGKTYREIVKILRVSPSTVARVLKQYAREREINELREAQSHRGEAQRARGESERSQEIVQVDGGPRAVEEKQLQVLRERRLL